MIEQFQNKASDSDKQRYYLKFMRHLEGLLEETDAKTRRASLRLDMKTQLLKEQNAQVIGPEGPPAATADSTEPTPEYLENVAKLEKAQDQVKVLEFQMNELAEEGKINESQALMKLTEPLKAEITELSAKISAEDEAKEKASAAPVLEEKEKMNKTKVCEVCGVFTSANPEDARSKSHVVGKQHLGYEKIRETVKEIKIKWDRKRIQPESIAYRREDRERDQDRRRSRNSERRSERSRSPRQSRDRDRDRDRDRHRDRRDRDRDYRRGGSRRERSRSRDRDRDRDRYSSRSRRY